MNSNMRFRTPVTKKSVKHSGKASPPSGKSIPLQQCRKTSIQQARGPVLELFEPSPVSFRYTHFDQSPLNVEVRPKYPREELGLKAFDLEQKERRHRELAQKQETRQRPLTLFGLFAFMVIGVATLHLINVGSQSFDNLNSSAEQSGFLYDKTSFLRSSHRHLLGRQPRVLFMGQEAYQRPQYFPPEPGRKVALYSADRASFGSDATQIYSLKSSDDTSISSTIERKFFPMHETNEDCIPQSDWQTETYCKYEMHSNTYIVRVICHILSLVLSPHIKRHATTYTRWDLDLACMTNLYDCSVPVVVGEMLGDSRLLLLSQRRRSQSSIMLSSRLSSKWHRLKLHYLLLTLGYAHDAPHFKYIDFNIRSRIGTSSSVE